MGQVLANTHRQRRASTAARGAPIRSSAARDTGARVRVVDRGRRRRACPTTRCRACSRSSTGSRARARGRDAGPGSGWPSSAASSRRWAARSSRGASDLGGLAIDVRPAGGALEAGETRGGAAAMTRPDDDGRATPPRSCSSRTTRRPVTPIATFLRGHGHDVDRGRRRGDRDARPGSAAPPGPDRARPRAAGRGRPDRHPAHPPRGRRRRSSSCRRATGRRTRSRRSTWAPTTT